MFHQTSWQLADNYLLGGITMEDYALKPPYSNTGAERTKKERLQATVDWVSVTFTCDKFHEVFTQILKMPEGQFIFYDKGLNGCTECYQRVEFMKVFANQKRPEMGVSLMMSGTDCRYFESILKAQKRNWNHFFKDCIQLNGHFTRIDIAFDDYAPYFRLEALWKKVKKQEVVAKFRKSRIMEEVSLASAESFGKTIYFGSNYSRQMFRFYEKGLQQLKKIKSEMDLKYLEELYQAKEITERNDPAIDLNQNPYYEDIDFDYYQNWNRYEIVCKQENAQEVAYHFATGLLADSLLLSIMNDYMRVTNRGTDTKRSRWKTWRPWAQLMKDIKGINISMKPKAQTILNSELWLRHSVSQTLFVYLKTLEDANISINELFQVFMEQTELNPHNEKRLETLLQDNPYKNQFKLIDESVILKKEA